MRVKTTISLSDEVKIAGTEKSTSCAIRGGFSGYVENLILEDLKKDKLKTKPVTDDYEQ